MNILDREEGTYQHLQCILQTACHDTSMPPGPAANACKHGQTFQLCALHSSESFYLHC